jgi:hypothetical protein
MNISSVSQLTVECSIKINCLKRKQKRIRASHTTNLIFASWKLCIHNHYIKINSNFFHKENMLNEFNSFLLCDVKYHLMSQLSLLANKKLQCNFSFFFLHIYWQWAYINNNKYQNTLSI